MSHVRVLSCVEPGDGHLVCSKSKIFPDIRTDNHHEHVNLIVSSKRCR